jgi:hypothetical protein
MARQVTYDARTGTIALGGLTVAGTGALQLTFPVPPQHAMTETTRVRFTAGPGNRKQRRAARAKKRGR